MSPTGWTDNELAVQWTKNNFMPCANSKLVNPEIPVFLILDGHNLHESVEIKQEVYSYSNCDITIFCFPSCFPSKTTHKLQPLDVVVFSPVRGRWQDHCNICLYQGVKMNCYNVIQEYTDIWKWSVTPELIRTLFLMTGIYPINPGVFTKEDFVPSQASSTIEHSPLPFHLMSWPLILPFLVMLRWKAQSLTMTHPPPLVL